MDIEKQYEFWASGGMPDSEEARRMLAKDSAGNYKLMQAYSDHSAFKAGFEAALKAASKELRDMPFYCAKDVLENLDQLATNSQ